MTPAIVTPEVALPRTLTLETALGGIRHGLRDVLGVAAWNRLPEAVRERFDDTTATVTYAGTFEIVRASLLGRLFAWLGVLFGMPVTPRCGSDVAARVVVQPDAQGVVWTRVYEWADSQHLVRSTKVVDGRALTEKLPARLNMPLEVYEEHGALHFVSKGYYFDLPGLKLWLPGAFSPGVTHVEHVDLGHGWFRFTMIVMHPWFGELFFQTGRFCALDPDEPQETP
jgi:hypothetical protein